MPPDPRDLGLLRDMLEAARRALRHTKGRSFNDLETDEVLADAVVRALQIVGEAARGVGEESVAAHPQIAWRAIIKTRHILVHDYGGVDLEIVWRIVQVHLPVLIQHLEEILKQSPPPTAEE